MFQVGITGGMGSGKSTIADIFKALGIPVLKSDDAAKYLMENEEHLRKQIQELFGVQTYENGRLNRPFLANIVFQNPEKLNQLNNLVHPAVFKYSNEWAMRQSAPYIVRESALFFETGSHTQVNFMIGVWAPKAIRINRVQARNLWPIEEIENRMSKQMDEAEKMKRCDAVINNDGTEPIIVQVMRLNKELLILSQQKK